MRGPHPEDARAFSPHAQPTLRCAVAEVGWLLDRGYSSRAAGTIVGDHHQLTARQRRAVMRCACGVLAARRRAARRRPGGDLDGRALWIDGFNVLLTVEAALGGQTLLLGQDGYLRDMASSHGGFVGAEQTPRALELVGEHLAAAPPAEVRWLFDGPVPHSGRLAALVQAVGEARGWPWTAETVPNPDPVLKASDGAWVATADGAILDLVTGVGLAEEVVRCFVPEARILALDAWLEDGGLRARASPVGPSESPEPSTGSHEAGGQP